MRAREYDTKDVLEKAMVLFWQQGFHNTSMENLTQATQLSRSSLYEAFHSKEGIFLQALAHYEEQVVDAVMGELERSGLGLTGIEQAFGAVLAGAAQPDRWGCLMCNTSSELAGGQPAVVRKVQAFHGRVRAAFLGALRIAKRSQEVAPAANVEQLADFLGCAFQGLCHAIRSPMERQTVQTFVSVTLSTLRHA